MCALATILHVPASFAGLAQFGSPGFSSGPPAIFMFFFVVIFIVVIGGILFTVGKGVVEWTDNNQQPVLTVPAKVVTKRTQTRVDSSANTMGGNDTATFNSGRTTSSTSYFATFEFSSGDRKEFKLSAHEYGLLAEQDVGNLTFQGTRYQGFQRANAPAAAPTEAADPASPVAPTLAGEPAFCPFCGVEVTAAFKFCPKCGKPQPEYVES